MTWVLQQATTSSWEDKAEGTYTEMMDLSVAGDDERGIDGCAAHRLIHREDGRKDRYATYGEDATRPGG